MSDEDRVVHIVHDAAGRIIAIAPVAGVAGDAGSRRGVTPAPSKGQFAIRLALSAEQFALGPVAIVRGHQVDLTGGQPALRAR